MTRARSMFGVGLLPDFGEGIRKTVMGQGEVSNLFIRKYSLRAVPHLL
jgi:hypothetical protein